MPCRRAAGTRTDIAALSHSGHSNLQVITVSTDLEFAALKDAWGVLERTCTARSVFLTHDWFDAAWTWRRLDSTLLLQVALRDAQVVGILPLVHVQDPRRRTRRVELLTVPDTHLVDLIVAPDDLAEVSEAVADALATRGDWDELRLSHMSPEGAAVRAFVPAMQRRGFRLGLHEDQRNPFVTLNGGWDEYYKTRSRRLKKANNNAANRLKKTGDVFIERFGPEMRDESRIDPAVETIIDISSRSWKRTTTYGLNQPGPQAFIRRLSTVARERGWLSIWLLHVDQRPLAMEYQLVYEGDIHALRADFDASCEETSPGSYLFRHLLEASFERGMKRYYMGPGENPYKTRWTEDSEPLTRVTVYNRTVRGRFSWLRDVKLKPPLRSMRDRLVGWQQARRPAPVSDDDPIGA